MKVLVVGSGAREHALVRSLRADPGVESVVCAPGNPGMALLGDCVPVAVDDPVAVASVAADLGVDLVVVGPEAPLVAGVADGVRARGIAVFGPSAAAARLEGSKAFAKEIMAAAGVPTAMARVCTTPVEVAQALDSFGPPYVVKDDGLAAGKGVVVTDDRAAALDHAAACFARAAVAAPAVVASSGPAPSATAASSGAGASGPGTVIVEEFLDGPEVSLFVVTDGRTVVPLAPAQDFKRVGDGDVGPNTGGMGAYSPLPWARTDLVDEVVDRVARPVVEEMDRRGTPFRGLLYCGLALTSRGLRVVEFNVRFGDPETQVVLARLRSPLAALLMAAADGTLDQVPPLRWSDGAAVTVVVAAANYPGTPVTGDPIGGLDEAGAVDGAWVLHAGTRSGPAGTVLSSGGRVLSVVGTGATIPDARACAYRALTHLSLPGSHHRTDIAAVVS